MNTTTTAQLNHTTTWPVTPRLTYRERELLSLLQAGGPTWTPDTKLARISLKFEELIHRLRAHGIAVQTFSQANGSRCYRLTPKPAPLPLSRPVMNPTVREVLRPATFVLAPLLRRQKSERTA